MWIIPINGEDLITAQATLDEVQHYQNQRWKSEVKISICRRKSYQKTDIEEIWFISDQVRPMVLYLEVRLPEKPLTKKNIVGALKCCQRQFYKYNLFVQYDKNKNVNLLYR